MIKELQRSKFDPLYYLAGDSLELYYTTPQGERVLVSRYDFKEADYFDTAIIFYIDGQEADALGIESGYGGIFGKAKDDKRNVVV